MSDAIDRPGKADRAVRPRGVGPVREISRTLMFAMNATRLDVTISRLPCLATTVHKGH